MSTSPSSVGIEWSTTEGVTPKLTSLMEQVTMSMSVAHDMESWNSQVENIMDPTILTGSCSSTNTGGTPMNTWGGLSPCRDLVISMNPGGVCHWLMVSPGCDSIFGVAVTLSLGPERLMDLPRRQWLWVLIAYAVGHHECTSGLSPMASAAASFLSSWGICGL